MKEISVNSVIHQAHVTMDISSAVRKHFLYSFYTVGSYMVSLVYSRMLWLEPSAFNLLEIFKWRFSFHFFFLI